MIRRGTPAVCVTGSRDCRDGPTASECARARRTKARELQTARSLSRSRVYRMMRKTLLITTLDMQRRPGLCLRLLLRSPAGLHQLRQLLLGGSAHGTANDI